MCFRGVTHVVMKVSCVQKYFRKTKAIGKYVFDTLIMIIKDDIFVGA